MSKAEILIPFDHKEVPTMPFSAICDTKKAEYMKVITRVVNAELAKSYIAQAKIALPSVDFFVCSVLPNLFVHAD